MNSRSLQAAHAPILKRIAHTLRQLPVRQAQVPDYHEKPLAFNPTGSRITPDGDHLRCDCGACLPPSERTCPYCDRTYDAEGFPVGEREAQADDDEPRYDFKSGDKVRLKGDYKEGDGSEVFTLTGWDGERGRVEDKQGRGWGVRGYQIEKAGRKKKAQTELSSEQYGQAMSLARESGGDFQRFVDLLAQKLDIRYQNLQEAQRRQLAKCFSDEHPHQLGDAREQSYRRTTAQLGGPTDAAFRVVPEGDQFKVVSFRGVQVGGLFPTAEAAKASISAGGRRKPGAGGGAFPRKAQVGLLQNPGDSSVVQADPELESIRSEAQALQAKVQDVLAKAQAYVDALANKEGAPDGGGMMSLQQEAARLQTELETRLKSLPQNFIMFSDGVAFAKVQSARLNDASWKDMIDAARTRGRGVMKRVTQVLDRLSILFKKLTADVKLEQYAPGELTPKEVGKVTKKNQENTAKIQQFTDAAQAAQPMAQKYFVDEAEGGMIQKPGFKGAQALQNLASPQISSLARESESMEQFIAALARVGVRYTTLSSADQRRLQGLFATSKNQDQAYVAPKGAGPSAWPVQRADQFGSLPDTRLGQLAAEAGQTYELDLWQELNESLLDSQQDIQYVNQDLNKAAAAAKQQEAVEESYPLPDSDQDGMQKAAAFKFSTALKGGLQPVRRLSARKNFTPQELREAAKLSPAAQKLLTKIKEELSEDLHGNWEGDKEAWYENAALDCPSGEVDSLMREVAKLPDAEQEQVGKAAEAYARKLAN